MRQGLGDLVERGVVEAVETNQVSKALHGG
jgi:hypothetical protein